MSGPRILDVLGKNEWAVEFIEAASVIANGGIVVHPTETLYGLAVDPWNDGALSTLVELKGRDAARGIIVLVSSLADAAGLIDERSTPAWRSFAEAFWPGALTLIVEPGETAPRGAIAASGGIAIRCSSDPAARALVLATGRAVTSTSANLSGRPPARTAREAAEIFGRGVSLCLDAGPREGGIPSTILDLRDGRTEIVREGAIGRAAIEAIEHRVRMSRSDGG